MTELREQHCVPCEGGVDPLDRNEAEKLLAEVPGWTLADDAKSIHRRFEFKGFYKTMSFINAMAWIANREGHHPDFEAGYNFCHVRFSTHAIDGLSTNDYICAARVNGLLED